MNVVEQVVEGTGRGGMEKRGTCMHEEGGRRDCVSCIALHCGGVLSTLYS